MATDRRHRFPAIAVHRLGRRRFAGDGPGAERSRTTASPTRPPNQLNRASPHSRPRRAHCRPPCRAGWRPRSAAHREALFADVGYRGSAPAVLASVTPMVAGYAQTAAALTAVTATTVDHATAHERHQHRRVDAHHRRVVPSGAHQHRRRAHQRGHQRLGRGRGGRRTDARVTAATGSGTAIGEGANVDRTVIGGDAPITTALPSRRLTPPSPARTRSRVEQRDRRDGLTGASWAARSAAEHRRRPGRRPG